MKKLPSSRVLIRLIDLDEQTGTMRWKKRPVWMFKNGGHGREVTAKNWNNRFADKPALHAISLFGYRVGAIFQVNYFAHRIVWTMTYGRAPDGIIDHINGDRTDNRIENLRQVSCSENFKNASLSKRNKSGSIGVHWCATNARWIAQIGLDGKSKHLGSFKTLEDALACRKEAEAECGFHKNHGRLKETKIGKYANGRRNS